MTAAAVLAVLQHLGPLHAQEKVLTLVLAFAPFVLLAAVVWLRRRQDAAEDDAGPA
jgi:hypothetical protein